MKTAREVAHEFLRWAANVLACSGTNGDDHNESCDRLTAAIEARDAEYAAELTARWNAINESLAVNRALTAERDRLREALDEGLRIVDKFSGAGSNDEAFDIIAELGLWARGINGDDEP